MDEQMTGMDSGVNGADAAGQSMENQQEMGSGQPEYETGVEGEQAAAAGEADRTEQAFARRLAAERQKIEGRYAPYRQLIERTAAQYQMTPQQYVETINRQMQERERREFQEHHRMTPEQFQGLVDRHPVVQRAAGLLAQQRQAEAMQAEADEFVRLFPEVTEVPPEVMRLKDQAGLRLADAYWRVMHQQEVRQARMRGEQDAIRNLQRNAWSTPGALGGAGVDSRATSVGRMDSRDFNSLVESVLRGERRNL